MCDRPNPPIRTRKIRYLVEMDSKTFIISKDGVLGRTKISPVVIMHSPDHFKLDEGVKLLDVSLNDRLYHLFFKYNSLDPNKLERLCCAFKNGLCLGIDR